MKNLRPLLFAFFLSPLLLIAQPHKLVQFGHADENDGLIKMIQTADGLYLAAGILDNDAVLYKFDCEGTIVYSYVLDLGATPSYEAFRDVVELPNGDVLAVGNADIPFATPAVNKVLATRLSASLQLLASDTMLVNGKNGVAKSIIRAANGQYYLAGEQPGSGFDFTDIFWVPFDPAILSITGPTTVITYGVDQLYYVNATADGNFLLSGVSVLGNIFSGENLLLNRAFIRKIKPDGTLMWDHVRAQTFKNKYGRAYCGDAIENPATGNILVPGTIFTGDTLNPLDIYEMLFSATGDSLDAKTVLMPGSQQVFEMKIIPLAGGLFFTVGDSTNNNSVAGLGVASLELNNKIVIASVPIDHTQPVSARSFVEIAGPRFVFGGVYFDAADPLPTRQDWALLFPTLGITVTNTGNTLTAAVSPAGAYQYQWYNGAQAIAGATGATFIPSANGTYAVVVTDAQGCTGSASGTVQCLLTATTSVTNVQCANATTGAATVAVNPAAPPFNYSWSNGANTTMATDLAPGNYTVTVTDANSCMISASATVLAVDNQPPVVICPANMAACPSDPVIVYDPPAATDNCGPGVMVALLDGLPSGAAFPIGTTIQRWVATDASGNTATCSFSVTIPTAVQILLDNVTDDINNQGIGAISISASGGVAPYSFEWTRDGVFFSTAEDLDQLAAGMYALELTDAAGCNYALGPITIDNIVKTKEPVWLSGISIQPNPANDRAEVVFPAVPGQSVALNVLDAMGMLVRSSEFNGLQRVPVDCADLPAGLYWVQIRIGSETGMRKLVVRP